MGSYINKFDLVFRLGFKKKKIYMPRAEGKRQSTISAGSTAQSTSSTTGYAYATETTDTSTESIKNWCFYIP